MTEAKELPSEIRLSAAMVRHFGDPEADAHLRRPEIWTGQLLRAFREGPARGDELPWTKAHDKVRLRPAEVSLWLGINGHGKTALTNQVALHLASLGRRVAIASLEMSPVKTLERMTRQAAGNSDPSEKFIVDFIDWLGGTRRLLLYDQHGRADWRFIAKVVRYAAVELKVAHFFIDSLMMIVPGEDDFNSQKDAITELCATAHDTGCHVHVVHHSRKLKDESEVPGKFDAKGTGSITDQVDNVLVTWRNKAKERDRAMAEHSGEDFDEEVDPDAVLVCDKQRHGEWEGGIRLWYDIPSFSYRGSPARPLFRGYDIGQALQAREPGEDETEAVAT